MTKKERHIDFSISPFIVIWEVTQACDLACHHCRAEAINWRDPQELSTQEGFNLIDEVHSMGTKIMVLSGGDPIKREDIFDLIRHGADLGVRMATIPAATPKLTLQLVKKLRAAGLAQMALSLDGPNAQIHDSFRGVPGAFDLTLRGADYAHSVGLPLQINSTFSKYNFGAFDEIAQLVRDLNVVFWEVFFLVPIGRGKLLEQMTAIQYEKLFQKLYRLSKKVDFIVKVTEAQHYRRYVFEQETKNHTGERKRSEVKLSSRSTRDSRPDEGIGRAPKVVNAGNGYVFISHTGEIYPSGFLPLSTGNVRRDSLARIYREHPTFKLLRNPDCLLGKCGTCEYRVICGGSRSRAHAMTGNYMESEPKCIYAPKSCKQ
ncbi:TIGR04053 family radical SAM/SPASM domain-containing protein [Desulfobacterota bacterium AH_259_B03_O07]|nr:TIGR04053 family radical SAM/SPASM domain-containing protein [Desulfobacterota bacterium AH_259_B03_O07]